MALAERRPARHDRVVSAAAPVDHRTVEAVPGVVPNPHRLATVELAGVTLAALAAGATGWMAVVPGRHLLLVAVTVAATFVTLAARGHFRVRMVPDTTSRLPLIGAAVAFAAIVGVAAASTALVDLPSAAEHLGLLVAVGTAAMVAQAVGVEILRRQWVRGNLRSKALVLGSDELARELAIEIGLRKEYGVNVVGFIAGAGELDRTLPAPLFDRGADIGAVFALTGADRLIIGPAAGTGDQQAVRLARWAGVRGIPVFVVPRFFELGLGLDSMSPDRARGYPLVRLQRAAHPLVSRRMKRVIDIAVAGSVLVAAAPVMAVVAVLVKLSSPGPVLFGQARVGQYGRRIVIHKFRSMTTSATSDREWTAEARVTPIGVWLRRLSLDELPQLWAIVRGDMSLVGPRPERPVFVERFRKEIADYDERHRMPVGLTGLAQIVGLRGDTSIAERAKYDNLYIDQWSVGTDLQILAKTVIAIARQHAYKKKVIELDQAIQEARPVSRLPQAPAIVEAA